jgi:hypothetical protein
VLSVDGVGLSIHGSPDLRTPRAASSEFAAEVERLQFTTGRGPCLLAATSGMLVFAIEELLERRWPAFYDLLVDKTPIRGMLALSLRGRLRVVGAMDLYFAARDGGHRRHLRGPLRRRTRLGTARLPGRGGQDGQGRRCRG